MQLNTSRSEWIILEEVDSTNSYVFRERLFSGSVVLAKHQSQGRGRRGKTWLDVAGGSFLFSGYLEMVLDDHSSKLLPLFPLITGLSVLYGAKKALNLYGSSSAGDGNHPMAGLKLKWPNDVLFIQNNRPGKLAGILLETELKGESIRMAIGVGLNWKGGPEQTPIPGEEFSFSPVSLFHLRDGNVPGPMEFAEILIPQLNANLSRVMEGEVLIPELERVSYLTDKTLIRSGKKFRVTGIQEDGGLALKNEEDGSLLAIYDPDWESIQ